MQEPERINIFGLHFSNTNIEDALNKIFNNNFSHPKYICFPSTNTISKAYQNTFFQKILNEAFLTVPDGKITELYARIKGFKKIETTSGYWLMDALLKSNLTHYFYGADDYTLSLLKQNIEIKYPNSKVLGYKSPPFIDLDEIEKSSKIKEDILDINKLKPDLIWIGISTVKQDYLMYYHIKQLNHGLMFGVGAVFLYMAGTVKKGPEWVKKLGLRWVLRLIQEPKRLFKSTFPSILFFLKLVSLDILKKITSVFLKNS